MCTLFLVLDFGEVNRWSYDTESDRARSAAVWCLLTQVDLKLTANNIFTSSRTNNGKTQ